MSGSHQPRRRLWRAAAPVAGLLAAGLLIWQGSSAAFSATTVNTADTWSSGTLTLTNNGGTAAYAASTTALFGGATEQNLKPGSTGTQCLTVQSGGTSAGALKFYVGAITGSAGLAGQIQLTIDAAPVTAATNVAANCTNFPAAGLTNLATGIALSALPTTYAGAATSVAVATGTQRVAYRFAWTFVSTGTNAGDNALQGVSAATPFNFEID
jgi:hypothetical protein